MLPVFALYEVIMCSSATPVCGFSLAQNCLLGFAALQYVVPGDICLCISSAKCHRSIALCRHLLRG